MNAATLLASGRPRRPDEAAVGRRAAAALVALLLAALAGAGVLIAHTIEQRERNRVEDHLGIALQAALGEASRVASQAQQQAAALAGDRRLQRALAAGDRRTLARLTATVPGAAAVPGSEDAPGMTRPSIRREVRVLAKGRLLGTVAITVPLDGAFLARLRAAAPLAPGEGFLFLRGDRVVASAASFANARVPPHVSTARLAAGDYQVAQTRLLGGPSGTRLAAFAPAAEAGAPIARSERILAASLVVTFAALLLLARMLAHPVLAPLARLAREARSSTTDDLTGLPNRRAFAQTAATELARARRSRRPLAVALVDVDDFKRVNDTYGHAAGDRVLRGVADVLRAQFREIDTVARYGGEEFAVLLPETGLVGATEAAERFIVALAGCELGDDASLPRRITASAGVASGTDTPIEALLDTADRALYRAKGAGKNRVQA